MKKLMMLCFTASFGLGCLTVLLYKQCDSGLLFSLAVTFFTTFYHIAMRLVVGGLTPVFRRHCREKDVSPFYISDKEAAFYKMIQIKQWKRHAPTYNKKLFDISDNSYAALCHNMANAQIGHGTMAILSFVPLLFSNAVDGFWPFFLTSVLAALFDMQFVMIQRYNRARISRIWGYRNKQAESISEQH